MMSAEVEVPILVRCLWLVVHRLMRDGLLGGIFGLCALTVRGGEGRLAVGNVVVDVDSGVA